MTQPTSEEFVENFLAHRLTAEQRRKRREYYEQYEKRGLLKGRPEAKDNPVQNMLSGVKKALPTPVKTAAADAATSVRKAQPAPAVGAAAAANAVRLGAVKAGPNQPKDGANTAKAGPKSPKNKGDRDRGSDELTPKQRAANAIKRAAANEQRSKEIAIKMERVSHYLNLLNKAIESNADDVARGSTKGGRKPMTMDELESRVSRVTNRLNDMTNNLNFLMQETR